MSCLVHKLFQRTKKHVYLNRNKESGVVGNGVFARSQLVYRMHGLLSCDFLFLKAVAKDLVVVLQLILAKV